MGVYENTVVAFGEYRQTPEMYHPNTFLLNIAVRPDEQGRGFGSQLYAHLVSELHRLQPMALRATTRADNARSVAFLERRGFVCEMCIQEWHLDLETLDLRGLDRDLERLQAANIRIRTVDELRTDPDRDRKLYDLIAEIREDVLLPESPTRVDFQRFVDSFVKHPSYDPDAAFVAMREGEYLGYSDLRDDGADGLYGGLTGVLRTYRRQGVALALKRWGMRYGRLQGCRRIRTFCASENLAMCAINRKCGFFPRWEWKHFETGGENSWSC